MQGKSAPAIKGCAGEPAPARQGGRAVSSLQYAFRAKVLAPSSRAMSYCRRNSGRCADQRSTARSDGMPGPWHIVFRVSASTSGSTPRAASPKDRAKPRGHCPCLCHRLHVSQEALNHPYSLEGQSLHGANGGAVSAMTERCSMRARSRGWPSKGHPRAHSYGSCVVLLQRGRRRSLQFGSPIAAKTA
jgi:hypothetical protein